MASHNPDHFLTNVDTGQYFISALHLLRDYKKILCICSTLIFITQTHIMMSNYLYLRVIDKKKTHPSIQTCEKPSLLSVFSQI